MSDGLSFLGSGDLDQSFFGRSGANSFNQQGLRDTVSSPEQGQQFNTISREASRNLFNSIIRPSDWKSVLGTQPKAESNYRLDSGEYTPEGSVRSRTGLSGLDVRAPSSMQQDYSIRGYGPGTKFGGSEDSYDFTYQDEEAQRIARTGTLGALSQDQSGVAYSQAPFDMSQPYQFGESGETEFGRYGGGSYSSQGQASADLQAPQSQLNLNNQIQKRLAGSGTSRMQQSTGGEGQNTANEITKVGSTGEWESRATKLGIAAATKAASMGVTSALAAANMAAWTNPVTAAISLASLPLQYFGGKAAGRVSEKYRTDKFFDTTARAESGLGSATELGLEGPGSVDFSQDILGQASATNQSKSGWGGVGSDVYTGLGQRAGMRLGPQAQGNINMLSDVAGASDTLLKEHEIIKKSGGNYTDDKSYSAQGASDQAQQATLLGQANIQNQEQMARQSVPQEWVSSNVDSQMVDNFQTYKDRFPGLYGNYANADDFITREYFRQNPQAEAEFNQQANVETISNATASPMYGDTPFTGLDYNERNNLGVDAGGQISLSGPGGVDATNLADVSTQQTTKGLPSGWGTTLGYNTSSTIDAQLNSELTASLTGLGAQANAVNDLKFNFNDTEYGATLQLNAQRFINNLEEQMPITRDSQLFIEGLRTNPELTALFEQGIAPETIVQATLNYDNTNKTFQNKLEWEQEQNYQQAQVYDPTPDQPNSGDEMNLANIMGDVRQLDAGKLYDVGYTDVLDYTTDYKLPTPMTNQSNEYLADQYNWNQELNNNMYYYTPGESDMYNSLAGEFVNRRYDLTDQFDTTGADQYLQQIQGLQEGQGMDNYSYEELQNIQNLLQQERQYDLDPTGRSLTGEMSQEFFLPETEAIDPQFKYSVEGIGGGKYKGFLQDPRLAQPNVADTLDKYYNYDNWFAGQKMRNEVAYMSGRTPGMAGSGNERIDPVTGQPLTAAREMTPEEFAQVQITRDKTAADIAGIESPTYQQELENRVQTVLNPAYNPFWAGSTPTIQQNYQYDVGQEVYDQDLAKYNQYAGADAYSGLNKYTPQYATNYSYFGLPPTTYHAGSTINPEYNNYQSQLGSSIQDYLAQNNLNSPV